MTYRELLEDKIALTRRAKKMAINDEALQPPIYWEAKIRAYETALRMYDEQDKAIQELIEAAKDIPFWVRDVMLGAEKNIKELTEHPEWPDIVAETERLISKLESALAPLTGEGKEEK